MSLTLHLLVGGGVGFAVASALIILCYFGLRKKNKKPGKKSKVRISLASIKNGVLTDDAEEQLLDDPEQPDSPKCHDCRKISTPENPCKCDRDIWENYVQDKPCMLQFSLYYNYHNSRLLIHIICAVNVAQKSSWHGKYPSTRVRFQLLPSAEVYQTEVKSNTAEPMFNETFDFIGYSQSDIQELKLLLGLYAYDRFSRKKMLGFLELPFDTVCWDASHPVILWQNLQREAEGRGRSISNLIKGELQFSLRYDAKANRLNVVILKATNLPRVAHIRGTGFYVTATFMDGDHEVETQQTKKKRSHNPVWNKGFLFDVDPQRFETYGQIIIKVFNHGLLFTDDLIGGVTVGPGESGNGLRHWQEMIKKKNVHREVAITHALQ